MNKVFLSGRLTKDPDVRNGNETTITKFTLAVDRKIKKGEEKKADFINCTVFGNLANVVSNYCKKGTGVNIDGRLQTGSYKNKDGVTVYTTDVIVDNLEFPLSNKDTSNNNNSNTEQNANDSFMNIPNGYEEELPFN